MRTYFARVAIALALLVPIAVYAQGPGFPILPGGSGAPNATGNVSGAGTTVLNIPHTFTTAARDKAVITCRTAAGQIIPGNSPTITVTYPDATTIRLTFSAAPGDGTICNVNATGTGATGPAGADGTSVTAVNTGSSGTGLFKQKTGLNLEMYKIASADNLMTIALSGTDFVQMTINQSNFALGTSQITSGTFADGRISASSVTQHQTALSIAASQLTGSLSDARVAQSNVTQHQAALAIAGTQLTSGVIPFARIPVGTTSTTVAVGDHAHTGIYQPLDTDLTTFGGLACSDGQIPKRVSGAWACSADATGGGGGGGSWGSITGTLSDQTDLASALAAKAPLASPTFTGAVTASTFAGDLTGNAATATQAAGIANSAIALLTEDTSPDSAADFLVTYKPSILSLRKVKPGNITISGSQVSGNISGNAATATALAANGSNCPTNQAAGGVSAAGAAEACIDLPATYQPLDADLTALAALSSTGGMLSRTGAGTFTQRTIAGTTNQITVTNGDGVSGTPTISIPNNPTLPGTTTGTFSGNVTGNITGNASTATALASNPTNCIAGQAANGVAANGAAEGCIDLDANYQQKDGELIAIAALAGTGFVAHSGPGTVEERTITGTTNEVAVTNGNGVSGNPQIGLASTIDLSGKTSTKPSKTSTSLPGTCSQGETLIKTDAPATQQLYVCTSTNTWTAQGSAGGAAFSSTTSVSYSATPTFTVPSSTTNGAIFKITLTGDVTSSTLASVVNGQTVIFIICQDSTGGRSFTWPTNVIGGKTINATQNSQPSTCYTQSFRHDGSNAYGDWELTAGSSGALVKTGTNKIDIDTSIVPRLPAANTWQALQTFDSSSGIDIKRGSAPANPASGYLRFYADNSDGKMKCKDSSGSSCLAASAGGGSGATKYTVAFGALDAAGTSDETLVTLTSGKVVRGCLTKHSTAFTGGSLSAVTVSIGISGANDLFCPVLDVFATAANTLHKEDPILWPAEGSQAVIAHFICTGANCNAATAGSLDVYLWVEDLP